jgi:hypothetical protein
VRYEIQTVADGQTFTSADAISAAARLCGVSAQRQAEHDARVLNDEVGETAYRAVRVKQ